jgi:hypothetical protein
MFDQLPVNHATRIGTILPVGFAPRHDQSLQTLDASGGGFVIR